jgi:sec-independent protein translocase protein TatA
MPFNITGWELLVVLVIALLLFGARLPSVGRSIGKTIVEFKKGMKDVQEEISADAQTTPGRLPEGGGRASLQQGDTRRVSQADRVEDDRER